MKVQLENLVLHMYKLAFPLIVLTLLALPSVGSCVSRNLRRNGRPK